MLIGGLQKNTLLDYPGKIGTVVFSVGCNFNCPFCYAPELVILSKIKKQPKVPEDYFFKFIKERIGKIDGIVICGGEPTVQKDLPGFIEKIKKLGFLIKLDTNGYLPEVLEKLIKEDLLDYVAMDIKAPKNKYQKYTGRKINISKIEKSIKVLKLSANEIDYEFRTTIAPGITREDIFEIVKWILATKTSQDQTKKYFLQEFLATKELISPKIKDLPTLKREEIKEIIKEISPNFKICKLR